MGGNLLHVGATAMCPHAGQVSIISTNARVMLGGQPAATASDVFLVSGCPFMVSAKPQPCLKIQWIAPAVRVRIGGQPAVLQTSLGLCQSPDQIPQGPPNIIMTQVRVRGI